MASRKDCASYTEAEKNIMRRLYPSAPQEEILAAMPGRKWVNLRTFASNIGVARLLNPVVYYRWTEHEDAVIKMLARTMRPGLLVSMLPNRDANAIGKRAAVLGCPYDAASHVRSRAFVGPRLPSPPKKAYVPVVRVARPKAVKVVVERPVAVKRSPATPVANLQRAMMVKKKKVAVPITAEEFKARRVAMYTPEWWSYTNGGWRGWQEFQQKQAA